MPLRGYDDGWKDASAVYGRVGPDWLYAKVVYARQNGNWVRAWTDCRQLDAGGRGWTPYTETETETDSAGCGSCGTRTRTRTRTRYEKEGCPTYWSAWSAWGAWTSCTGNWTASTGDFTENGILYRYVGPAGYYEVWGITDGTPPGCSPCSFGCDRVATYFVENCSLGGRRGTTSPISCGTCVDVFQTPC